MSAATSVAGRAGPIDFAEPRTDSIVWIIAAAVMLATFMEVLDTSIAAVSLPYIAGSLSATNDEATWVLTSYLVANAIVLPASGWFSLRFGRKRFLLACIMIFTASSFMCGAATSLGMILIARALQGAGGGALQPLSQAILFETFPPEKRGIASAAFGLGVVVAPVLGPTLGGWITEAYTWRWAFYINIPIGILAVILISRFVQDPPYIRNARPGKLDAIGLGLLAVWLAALQIILDKGQEDDWFGAIWIRYAVVILITAFIAFLVWELTYKKPLVDLRIFTNRNFAIGCLLIALFGVVIYGIVTILPLFFQTLLGYTALAAGWAVSPRGVGAIFAMPLVGVLSERVDSRWLIAIGFGGVGACTMWLGNVSLQIGEFSMFWAIILSGFFIGFVFVPLVTMAMGRLPNELLGNAAGLYNLLRNVGGSIGISVVNTLLVRRAQVHQSQIAHDITPGTPDVQQRLHAIANALSLRSDPVTAMKRAAKLIELSVMQQSQLWAYIDDFRYLALLCFACIPLAFALQRVRSRPGAGRIMAH
ncbi:MAG TPA: DHA2 family efflux MFS transporter permease subunit [Candidatus Acidoferrales bacterium]|jgi:DHA2 family multidrug resistance protein|nr:DHA2 family efflux MFS transporter permease subunit [Candidatus Acidoferrales bacterium]